MKRGTFFRSKYNKLGVSSVVAVVFLVMLTMAIAGIIWTIINNLVKEKTEESKSCYEISDSIEIEKSNTCYNLSSKELNLYINVKDFNLSSALISVSSNQSSFVFRLNDTIGNVNGVSYLNGTQSVRLPKRNSGTLYLINMSEVGLSEPKSVQVAPFSNKLQCDVLDSLQEINNC